MLDKLMRKQGERAARIIHTEIMAASMRAKKTPAELVTRDTIRATALNLSTQLAPVPPANIRTEWVNFVTSHVMAWLDPLPAPAPTTTEVHANWKERERAQNPRRTTTAERRKATGNT